MDTRRQKKPTSEKPRKPMEEVGGEPLAGSGFEGETPASEFSDTEPAAPTQQ